MWRPWVEEGAEAAVKVAIKRGDYKMEMKGGKSWWSAVFPEAQDGEHIENSILFGKKRVMISISKCRIIAASKKAFKRRYFDRWLDSGQNLEDFGLHVVRKNCRET